MIAVVLFHAGISWATGGFLGVELFFVLSGFLITSGLIGEWRSGGRIGLASFWVRRARRLAPALLILMLGVGIYYAVRGTFVDAVPGLFGDGLSALLGYANWHQIATGSSAAVHLGGLSPFQHTWSLAIEEQFYVLWPLLVLGLAVCLRRGRRGGDVAGGPPSDADAVRLLNALAAVTLAMLVASAVDTALLVHGDRGLDRVLYGTDSRASGLLAGVALAVLTARLRLGGQRAVATTGHGLVAGPGLAAGISVGSAGVLAGSLALMARVDGDGQRWLYPWGLLLTDLCAVALVAVILTSPRAIASRIFTLGPLRWIGRISYGLYLWQFPLFLWISRTRALHGVWLDVVRIAAALAVAALSYQLVEAPVREGRWPVWLVRGLAPVTAAAGVVALALAAGAGAVPRTPTKAPAPVVTDLAGTQGPCTIRLANTEYSGEVAPPKLQETSFQTRSLGHGTVRWPTVSAHKTFTTCPPKRALVIGDSIAFTIATPFLYDEQRYGTAISNAAILGCAFGVRGQLDVNGTWEPPPAGCSDELNRWKALADRFGADEIIVELGYRDEFNWRWDGRLVHLGEPAYDSYVEARIRRFIAVLGEHGRRKLLFLSIPYVHPTIPQPNGLPAPQASCVRHGEINRLIAQAATSDGADASVLDIDRWLSPHGRYTTYLNGQLCRFDGIHVSVYCAGVLEPHVFAAARALLGTHSG